MTGAQWSLGLPKDSLLGVRCLVMPAPRPARQRQQGPRSGDTGAQAPKQLSVRHWQGTVDQS